MLFKVRDSRGDMMYVESSDYKIHTKVVSYTDNDGDTGLKLVFTLSMGMDSQELGEADLLDLLDLCSVAITGVKGSIKPDTKVYLDGFVQSVSDFIATQGDYLTIFRDLKHDNSKRRELRDYVGEEYKKYLMETHEDSLSTLREIVGC